MIPFRFLILLLLLAGVCSSAMAQKKHAPIREDIPFGGKLAPKMEEPVFAVSSKQGGRILVSRDDGKTWQQTFLGTESLEDGGWHGTFAVYGMAYTGGVIGVFSGWGTPGVYIGSDDGVNWCHLNAEPIERLGSVWGATGGQGKFLTSADMWRGMTSSGDGFASWQAHKVGPLLADGEKTHHMICGYGDYKGGRFIVIGDNQHVFYSEDGCESWKHSRIPEEAGGGQEVVVYGNGVFLCRFKEVVARSEDGGETWTLHDPGLKGWGNSWRGLSFVNGEFWLTAQKGSHGRKSKDGITWEDLPKGTPGGRFVQSEGGTIVNVERRRYDIKRSGDGGQTWESVFTPPKEDVSWDTAFAVWGKVNAP
ncbi:MAG: sialidase family protein [Verrucomicrobiales bacterium]|nr:sialidase family protein [Verrucomicrobiales bacterium]